MIKSWFKLIDTSLIPQNKNASLSYPFRKSRIVSAFEIAIKLVWSLQFLNGETSSFIFLYNLKRNASQTCKMNTITKRWKKMKFVFYFAHTLTFWDIILWRIKTNHSNIWTNHIRFTSLFPTLQQDNLAHFQIQSCFRYNCHKLTIYSLHYYGIHGNLWLEWHYFYVRNPFHLIAIL